MRSRLVNSYAKFCIAVACLSQEPRMLIARDATATVVTSEIVLSSIISILAREVSGNTSVGLNAVAVEYARYR